MENKIGLRRWLMFILAGFVGQLAWAIEANVHFSWFCWPISVGD